MITLLLQVATWLWPLAGMQPGDGIIAQPQDMIGDERNANELFLSAPLGTDVLAPADCTLGFSCLTLMQSLTSGVAYGGSANNFDGQRAERMADGMSEASLKYVNGSVTLRLADGRKIHINGLRGDVPMKSGQHFRRGERLGTVAWAFLPFSRPHICISVTSPSGNSDDPMKPFGLPSTFIAPKQLIIPETITRQQAETDLQFLISSMHECFPEFRSVVSEDQEQAFLDYCRSRMTGNIVPTSLMGELLGEAFTARLLHDSHANASGNLRVVDMSRNPHLRLGVLSQRLIVTQAQPGWEQYLQREVASVDDRPAAELISDAWLHTSNFDEQIRSVPERQMLTTWQWYLGGRKGVKRQTITFADGTSVVDTLLSEAALQPYLPNPENLAIRMHSIDNCVDDWTFRMLADSIALLTLGTFELSEMQVDEIEDSLRCHRNTPYIIIDVRDNSGGHAWVVDRLSRWFLGREPRPTLSWQQVVSDSTYSCFSSCLNYDAKSQPFRGYKTLPLPLPMREGSSMPILQERVITPLPHREGLVESLLLLTNETSFSAASDLPARLVREGRAITVGRETGTGYHAMTALKFAHLILPNSKFQYRLPLIRCVTDGEISPRFPEGRGLLPDVEVPLSWEEMFQSEDDIVLQCALQVIANFPSAQHP